MDKEEPNLPNLLIETDEPKCIKSSTDNDDPKRPYERKDTDELMWI